jgi:hypothetical protein
MKYFKSMYIESSVLEFHINKWCGQNSWNLLCHMEKNIY